MAANFKFGKIPGSVLVSGALDVSERSFVGSDVAMNIERYLDCVPPSAPRSCRWNGAYTYTSRIHVFGAILRVPQNSQMVERYASWTLKSGEKPSGGCIAINKPLTASNEICKESSTVTDLVNPTVITNLRRRQWSSARMLIALGEKRGGAPPPRR